MASINTQRNPHISHRADVKGKRKANAAEYPEPALHKFLELPKSVRTKIWIMSMHSRIVEVFSLGPEQWCHTYAKSFSFRSPTKPPAVLHVCQESREIGLCSYSLEFECKVLRSAACNITGYALPRIYLDYSHDTVYFRDAAAEEHGQNTLVSFAAHALGTHRNRVLANIRHLAIRYTDDWVTHPTDFLKMIRRCPRLDTIELVFEIGKEKITRSFVASVENNYPDAIVSVPLAQDWVCNKFGLARWWVEGKNAQLWWSVAAKEDYVWVPPVVMVTGLLRLGTTVDDHK